jgi:hypothetical protein
MFSSTLDICSACPRPPLQFGYSSIVEHRCDWCCSPHVFDNNLASRSNDNKNWLPVVGWSACFRKQTRFATSMKSGRSDPSLIMQAHTSHTGRDLCTQRLRTRIPEPNTL